MIQNARLGAIATSYKDQRNGSDYVQLLESSFKEINEILLKK